MGKTKLQTNFKQYNCCTLTEYLQQSRISQAGHLLSDTDLNIGQIAKTVGYTSASRFAKLFRKSTGLLPGEFRKKAQK
ncbi:helix-turn-helix transcriptional regulator [Anaeromassilibacillus sp. Marseille-P3371]|uniref:helix-turn-helix domain-containing protein n=1 Tax=Anaeromassilibacillus sp. Marseille-P3371 TaxID=1944639 RepID=UPI000A1CF2A5